MRHLSRGLWLVYFVFAAAALVLEWHPRLLSLSEPFAIVKVLVWTTFVVFLGYSYYCSTREDLFSTIRHLAALHWGRQIGADLYIGLGLSLLLVSLHQGPVVALLWLLPTLVFGNLSILLYFSIHFDALVSRFMT